LAQRDVRGDLDNPIWSPLAAVLAQYRNQVLVDEATDFSPLQLSCMFSLTQRRIRSFFACGDLKQRLTRWGVQSLDEIKWATGDLEVRTIDIVYRQSTRLREFARELSGEGATGAGPRHLAFEGVPPALFENATRPAAIEWLACRIREVERFVHRLPSIAIFVNAESDVEPTATALDSALTDANIRVTACHEGQAVGTDTNVRVFDIQHIKGLEFEAAFFVDLDGLIAKYPDLYDKYIYVGATRAATYLGIICSRMLPPRMEGLRGHFTGDWSAPGPHGQ
jgi:DNA helicase IV